MYNAKLNDDGTFQIYTSQDVIDVNGNTVQIPNVVDNTTLDELTNTIVNIQAKIQSQTADLNAQIADIEDKINAINRIVVEPTV